MKTADVARQRPIGDNAAVNVVLVFDESSSMGSHLSQVNRQAEVIRQQLQRLMPDAQVQIVRFGSQVHASRSTTAARLLAPIDVGSDLGLTALNDALLYATRQAVANDSPTLIYLFTDGEENASRNNVYGVSEAVSAAMASGRVSYGCVGPRSAALSFTRMGIPGGAIRTWDGQRADLESQGADCR